VRIPISRLVAAAAVGVAAPNLEVALKCRQPSSEACVWSKSYLPLTRPLYFVLFGLLTYAVLSLILWMVARARKAPSRPA
jgi:hypothetical protein